MKDKPFNPVLMKELKLRFRNAKSFSGIVFYLLALTVFIFAYLAIVTGFINSGFFRPSESFILFCALTVLQMGLVLFMTPALTAGAISSEREKQTLNILLTTTQTSSQIIIGKLLSSIAFLLLILFATMPLYSLVFLFGGISPSQLLSVFFFFILTVFAIGSLGILFSTITKKTVVSMISTYGATIFLTVFTFIFFIVGATKTNGETTSLLSYFWISINPFAVVLSILSPDVTMAINEVTQITQPSWILYTVVYLVIAIVSVLIAIRQLRSSK
ncbi:ABC transporter permease [Solibacillus sp. FSL H8-0538]|uniref:ABC transporter permease n=1 Tax=Solibacillus sp. FSL H8-0538 TaxID=2921400 RepID=UPI0030FCF470